LAPPRVALLAVCARRSDMAQFSTSPGNLEI
jgi:hypothetical protein